MPKSAKELGEELGRSTAIEWMNGRADPGAMREIAKFGGNFIKKHPSIIDYLRESGWEWSDQRIDEMEDDSGFFEVFNSAFMQTVRTDWPSRRDDLMSTDDTPESP
jgi:hypothetical protein